MYWDRFAPDTAGGAWNTQALNFADGIEGLIEIRGLCWWRWLMGDDDDDDDGGDDDDDDEKEQKGNQEREEVDDMMMVYHLTISYPEFVLQLVGEDNTDSHLSSS